MSTVHKIQHAVQHVREAYISKAKARRFFTGVAQLSLQEFGSLNTAGRNIGINRWTGESRIRRIVTDATLSNQVQRLLVAEVIATRSGYTYCSLDHSQFGPFCIAILAISNRAGRAIPVWCQVNLSEAALIKPLLLALEALLSSLAKTAPQLKPVLVMDRWFASDKLFKLFAIHGAYFVCRTKSDKRIRLPWDTSWQRTTIREVSHLEVATTYRKHQLRLVRSELRPGMKDSEPWFLLTNLPDKQRSSDHNGLSRRQILNRYAERFEIEEAFKDVKWLQRLEWQRVKKPEVIRSILLFAFLGWWLMWQYVHPTEQRASPQKKLHPKKRLSWFRQAWEAWQRLLRTPLLPQVAVPAAALQMGVEK